MPEPARTDADGTVAPEVDPSAAPAGKSTPAAATAPAEGAATAPESPAPEAPKDEQHPRPEGEPEPVTKLREMIEAKLTEIAPHYLVDRNGSYVLGLESARIFVVPTWLENGMTVIRVFAITNLDVPVTADLTSYLLTKNLEFVFGGFALDAEAGAIWFNHNLLGQFTAPDELEATLAAVAQTADRFDDEIKSRFGGRLYVEARDATVPAPANPGYL